MQKIPMTKTQLPKQKGFTLVETLVAVAIFSVSIVGLMSALGQGISDTGYAKRKVVATYLAQEGIEYLRNLRDTYVLYSSTPSAGWNSFNSRLSAGDALCQNGPGCYFDDANVNFSVSDKPITALVFTSCGPAGSSASCPVLMYNSSTGRYNYNSSGSSSGFIRKITFEQLSASETRIVSTVYWGQGSGVKSISFSENLFNWTE